MGIKKRIVLELVHGDCKDCYYNGKLHSCDGFCPTFNLNPKFNEGLLNQMVYAEVEEVKQDTKQLNSLIEISENTLKAVVLMNDAYDKVLKLYNER